MPLLVTDAIVLHVFDYLESSRIFRLATREAGVQSVLARGARKSQRRYGSALDLFAEGSAQLQSKPGRDLHTLAGFDVVRSRPQLAADLGRFTAAAAIAELAMRFMRDDTDPAAFDALRDAFDAIGSADPGSARDAGLAGAWHLVGVLGFSPTLDSCAACHAELPVDAIASFSHVSGGALCARCARLAPGSRTLPVEARDALRRWLAGAAAPLVDDAGRRAHQRLLREFLREHLTDGRPLRAYEVWEHDRWSAT